MPDPIGIPLLEHSRYQEMNSALQTWWDIPLRPFESDKILHTTHLERGQEDGILHSAETKVHKGPLLIFK